MEQAVGVRDGSYSVNKLDGNPGEKRVGGGSGIGQLTGEEYNQLVQINLASNSQVFSDFNSIWSSSGNFNFPFSFYLKHIKIY